MIKMPTITLPRIPSEPLMEYNMYKAKKKVKSVVKGTKKFLHIKDKA